MLRTGVTNIDSCYRGRREEAYHGQNVAALLSRVSVLYAHLFLFS